MVVEICSECMFYWFVWDLAKHFTLLVLFRLARVMSDVLRFRFFMFDLICSLCSS